MDTRGARKVRASVPLLPPEKSENLPVDPGEEVQIAFNLSKAASKKDAGSLGEPGIGLEGLPWACLASLKVSPQNTN